MYNYNLVTCNDLLNVLLKNYEKEIYLKMGAAYISLAD